MKTPDALDLQIFLDEWQRGVRRHIDAHRTDDLFDKLFCQSPGKWFVISSIVALVVFGPPAVGAFVFFLVAGFFVSGLLAIILPPIGLACFAFWLFGLVYMLTHPL